jgi:hypothetical protein
MGSHVLADNLALQIEVTELTEATAVNRSAP